MMINFNELIYYTHDDGFGIEIQTSITTQCTASDKNRTHGSVDVN
jgi:hypothetical protein